MPSSEQHLSTSDDLCGSRGLDRGTPLHADSLRHPQQIAGIQIALMIRETTLKVTTCGLMHAAPSCRSIGAGGVGLWISEGNKRAAPLIF